MMSQQSNSGDIGFAGGLGIAFIVLKLTGTINWAWLWVLAPLWIPLAFVLVVCVIALIVVALAAVFKA
jgi:hypothetical protein